MYDPIAELQGFRRRARLRRVLTDLAAAILLILVPLTLTGIFYAILILLSMATGALAAELGNFAEPAAAAPSSYR